MEVTGPELLLRDYDFATQSCTEYGPSGDLKNAENASRGDECFFPRPTGAYCPFGSTRKPDIDLSVENDILYENHQMAMHIRHWVRKVY